MKIFISFCLAGIIVVLGTNVSFAQTNTWTGAVDTDWHKGCNWSLGIIPTCAHNVVIPSSTTNKPTITGVASCLTIDIQGINSTLLTINNGALLQVDQCPTANTVAACCTHGSQTFSYTGAMQTFNVTAAMAACGTMTIKSWGAGGGGGGGDEHNAGNGGGGSYSTVSISVTAGDVLNVYVGGGGSIGDCYWFGTPQGGLGGWGYGLGARGGNAGYNGVSGGGGGGAGSSGVIRSAILLVAAAGGGGGGGGGLTTDGGNAGGGGQDGSGGNPSGGTGGTTSSSGSKDGTAGGESIQCSPCGETDEGGGGGGGGGASATNDGGTGGAYSTAGDEGGGGGAGGDSFGTITPGSGQTPGNAADADLCAGCAVGGNGGLGFCAGNDATSGANGFVKIIW